MKKTAAQLNREIAESLARAKRSGHARKRKPKSPHEIRTDRLKTLRAIMEDVYDDPAWRDTDLDKIESWISVDDGLSNREWLDTAKNQLVDQSVLSEHAGAAPQNVYRWNDAFISTYHMNIDSGMSEQDAIDSAQQNAFDTVKLTSHERALIKDNPKLYED